MHKQVISAALIACATAVLTGCGPDAQAREYNVELTATLAPKSEGARVALAVQQDGHQLRRLNFSAPRSLFTEFSATGGKVTREGDRVLWSVPESGGQLSWHATLNVPKGSGYDARITNDWALLRFEDIFPPVKSTARKDTTSNFTLNLKGPKDWSFETRYGRLNGEPLAIESAQRNFDRPTGWLLAGKLGVRRETIANRAVTVAAPVGSRFPRIPTLAFLRWTLPTLANVFPSLPDRLLIVSGDESMWRGALSGPASLFMHPDRPLISENATSTLLHELGHVSMRISAETGDDWIVEGLAEYYSLEILRRSDGLSGERFDAAIDKLRDWVKQEGGRLSDPSKGVHTARAVLLFSEMASELNSREVADHEHVLDTVVQHLLKDRNGPTKVSRVQLQDSVVAVTGQASKVLTRALNESSTSQKTSD